MHVLVHELGHICCDHENRRDLSRAQREIEAESVAFIVCTVLGLAVGDVAATYVRGWTDGDPDIITAAQTTIMAAPLIEILRAFPAVMSPEQAAAVYALARRSTTWNPAP